MGVGEIIPAHTLLSLTNENDRQQLGRLVSLLQNPNSFYNQAHKAEFRLRLTAFFCVELADEAITFSYQQLVNIFFALLQTNYAFVKAEPGLASIHGASCAIFGQAGRTLRFEHTQRDAGSSEVAATIGNRILLFYDEKTPVKPQSPANLIHEIGHYFNARLGGAIDNPGGINPTSPLGRLAHGELNVGGRDISGEVVSRVLDAARSGMSADPYTQNGGWTCAKGDISCARNEEFADMFLHWVYEQSGSTIFMNDREGHGPARRSFMNNNITNWLCELRACGER